MKDFVVWGWSGMSRFDGSAHISAKDFEEAATIFMENYPFNAKFWKPHGLKVCTITVTEESFTVDEKSLVEFDVTCREPVTLFRKPAAGVL